MTEEDSDSVYTDSQTGEERELPVMQLCGLVEELRYLPVDFCGLQLLALDPRPRTVSDLGSSLETIEDLTEH